MRRAHWLLPVALCPSPAPAQGLPSRAAPAVSPPPSPWPSAHTPHPSADGSPPEADYSLAMPGRVPLTFASARTQNIVLVRRSQSLADSARGSVHIILGSATCTTPCTLYVPPGVVSLRAAAEGLRDTDEDINVPAGGATVRVRTASRALYNLGTGLVAAGGTVFVAEAVAAIAAQARGEPVPSGTALLFAGAAAVLLASGVPLMVTARSGVEFVHPTSAPRPPSLAVFASPTPNGAVALAYGTW